MQKELGSLLDHAILHPFEEFLQGERTLLGEINLMVLLLSEEKLEAAAKTGTPFSDRDLEAVLGKESKTKESKEHLGSRYLNSMCSFIGCRGLGQKN